MKKICGIAWILIILISLVSCGKTNNSEQRETELSSNVTWDNTTDNSERDFNFETRTVTLNSGYEMPLNGIGTYSLLDDTCVNSVSEALKRGVRLIDTAYMYDNEKEVGKAVRNYREYNESKNIRRSSSFPAHGNKLQRLS